MDHNKLGKELFDAMMECMKSKSEIDLTTEFVHSLQDGDWVYFMSEMRMHWIKSLCEVQGIGLNCMLIHPSRMFNSEERKVPPHGATAKFDVEWVFNYFLQGINYVADDMDRLVVRQQ